MPLRRFVRTAAAATALLGVSMITPGVGFADPLCRDAGSTSRHVVLFDPANGRDTAEREIDQNCGTLVAYYGTIGVGVVESADPGFVGRIGPHRAYSAQAEHESRTATGRQSSAVKPVDEVPDQQWNMAAIQAERARKAGSGGRDTIVGVLDSGIDSAHPDLAEAFAPARSTDCVTGTPREPRRPGSPGEDNHGTHIAGIIAAADDGRGVTGVAPRARIASVRVVDDAGYVHPENAVCGFVWAAENGIRVVNASFLVEAAQQGCGNGRGSSVPREALRRAVEYATSRGVLTVAALGNQRMDVTSVYRQAEANCDAMPVNLDGVVAVSAVNSQRVKAGYSSYGLGAVDIAAPGGQRRQGLAGITRDPAESNDCVISTASGGYGASCGTSMAAPHVSGVAALIAAQHPAATPHELAGRLTATATPLRCPSDYDLNQDSVQDALCLGHSTYNGFHGHGLVNAFNAVTR